MRTRTLLRQDDCAVYEVACRYHERPGWIEEGSRYTELVYPLQGGFLLGDGAVGAVCLPARLTLIPGGARYRIRHFRQLPDRTLVISMRNAGSMPREISHLFLDSAEACGLQLLAYALCRGDHSAVVGLPHRVEDLMNRTFASSILQPRLTGEGERLERGIQRMLESGADASPLECARAAGCGVHHFRHRFRATYATTPHHVVRVLRLARALRIMLEGATATTAAQVAGFAHVSHFSNECRRATGRSPTALLGGVRSRAARGASPHAESESTVQMR